jgi:hypothetical protein
MRVRWMVSMAVGVAILAGAGTIVAIKVQGGNNPTTARMPPTITVSQLAAHADHGVIASGTINSKAWRLRLTTKSSKYGPCSRPPSGWYLDCTEQIGGLLKYAHPEPVDIWDYGSEFFGPVRDDVDRVALRLSDGAVVVLHPVEVFGHLWIGVILPPGLGPAKAVAYSRSAELAHSIPFHDTVGDRYGFLSWLPAGDEGPRRMTKVVRGGGLTLVLHTGPWGNWLTGRGETWPFAVGYSPNGALSGGYGLPRTVPMAFPWPARYMTLEMSDGTTRHVRLVQGAGVGFAIIRAARNPSINEWSVFDGHGRRLSGGGGAPGGF